MSKFPKSRIMRASVKGLLIWGNYVDGCKMISYFAKDTAALGNIDIKLFSGCHSLYLSHVFLIYYILTAYRKAEHWKIQPEIFNDFHIASKYNLSNGFQSLRRKIFCTLRTLVTTCSLMFTELISHNNSYG